MWREYYELLQLHWAFMLFMLVWLVSHGPILQCIWNSHFFGGGDSPLFWYSAASNASMVSCTLFERRVGNRQAAKSLVVFRMQH